MSIKIMSLVWDSGALDGSALLALLALADYANEEGYCFPAYATIAKKTRVSERQAIRVVKTLIDDGFVTVSKQGDGRGISNVFKINITKLEEKRVTSEVEKGDIQGKKGDIQGKKRVTSRVKKGDIQGNRTIYITNIEPPIEPAGGPPKGEASSSGSSSSSIGGNEKEKIPATMQTITPPAAAAAAAPDENEGKWQAVCNAYESEIGVFTSMTSEIVREAMEDYGAITVVDAIKAAATQNVRKWAYVDGILKRWKANGRPSDKPEAKPVKLVEAVKKKNTPSYLKELMQ